MTTLAAGLALWLGAATAVTVLAATSAADFFGRGAAWATGLARLGE
ncbi:hypothetical protein [Mycobacterium sp. RTGN5]|nr:hypothetical protein [Mycobacterium sp. RTGN5]